MINEKRKSHELRKKRDKKKRISSLSGPKRQNNKGQIKMKEKRRNPEVKKKGRKRNVNPFQVLPEETADVNGSNNKQEEVPLCVKWKTNFAWTGTKAVMSVFIAPGSDLLPPAPAAYIAFEGRKFS